MFLGPLLIILFIIGIVFVVVSPTHNNHTRTYNQTQGYSVDRSMDILRERYAKGEITEEEFLRIKRILER